MTSKLIYFANASLNGCITDDQGKFGFTEPDDEEHQFVNDVLRDVGTHLYGRRLYETMMVWETDPSLAEMSPVMRDFAQIWQRAEKVVYSTTLSSVSTTRTRLETRFDPAAVKQLIESATRDLIVGGATLAGEAFRAGLVDECFVMIAPVIVRAGTRFLPDDVLLELELLSERRFSSGKVYLHYRRKSGA